MPHSVYTELFDERSRREYTQLVYHKLHDLGTILRSAPIVDDISYAVALHYLQ